MHIEFCNHVVFIPVSLFFSPARKSVSLSLPVPDRRRRRRRRLPPAPGRLLEYDERLGVLLDGPQRRVDLALRRQALEVSRRVVQLVQELEHLHLARERVGRPGHRVQDQLAQGLGGDVLEGGKTVPSLRRINLSSLHASKKTYRVHELVKAPEKGRDIICRNLDVRE